MKRIFDVFLVLCFGMVSGFGLQSLHGQSPCDWVNPFVGTGGHGHTFPGATTPFGMVQLSPDTRLEGWDGCSGYHYSDTIVYGFSHTHLSGTGVSDYGDILLMPTVGDVVFDNGYQTDHQKGYASVFDKRTEKAYPGFYAVYLSDYDIGCRFTATPRTGIHEYTYYKSDSAAIILDLTHRDEVLDYHLEVISDTEVRGYRVSKAWAERQYIYFVLRSSTPFVPIVKDKKLAMRFFAQKGQKVILKVGISAVDMEGAEKNLDAEAPHWDFDQYLDNAKTQWNKALSKIIIATPDEDKKHIFYSALYHTMIAPNVFSDVDGRYRGMDMKIHHSDHPVYTVFSLWDTFRGAHPLYTIIEQRRTLDFIRTMLRQYTDGGILPIWELAANRTGCMIGYHAIPVIVDAFVKGIRDFDVQKALSAMVYSASRDHLGLEAYKKKGYIAAGDEAESVSKTLEYSYDDWCIALMADSLGKNQIRKDFIKRAQYYKNLYNPESGFMQSKMNGGWRPGFDPTEVNFNFTEANSWQYSMFVPHDIAGLIRLHGGKENFETKLDKLFTTDQGLSGRQQSDITGLIGQYAHGNEPSHHMAYLYNFVGAPYKTQYRIHQILTEQYHNRPDGLAGNEDCGQMSAWYVLSSMGFYSVTPGMDYYAIGTPHFEEVTIHLENGKSFIITAKNLSGKNKYVQHAYLNGEPLSIAALYHHQITSGGRLVFEMGDQPNKQWGTHNMPVPAISDIDKICPVPFFSPSIQTFKNQVEVKVESIQPDANIYIAIDDQTPFLYKKPIRLTKTTTLSAFAKKNNKKSFTVHATYSKINNPKKVISITPYNNQYNAGGDQALVDLLHGNTNFRTGYWQGFDGKDVEVVIDLGKCRKVNQVSIGSLQDIKSWIWFPKEVEVYTSKDQVSYKKMGTAENHFPEDHYGGVVKQFVIVATSPVKARYIKVIAKNRGVCPSWHPGAGNDTWLFLDEIEVGEK